MGNFAVERLDHAAAFVAVGWAIGVVGFYFFRGRKKSAAGVDRADRQEGPLTLPRSFVRAAYGSLDRMANALAKSNVNPNALSWTGTLLMAAAAVFTAGHHYGFAGLAAMLAGACDMLDGAVAVREGRTSARGSVIDSTLDRYGDFFILAGIALAFRERPLLAAMAVLAMHGSYMISYLAAKAETMSVELKATGMKRPERLTWLAAGLVFSGLAGDGAADRPLVIAVLVVSVLTNVSAVKRFRELSVSAGKKGER